MNSKLKVIGLLLAFLSGCATVPSASSQDVAVYSAVLRHLASAHDIDGMQVSAWLEPVEDDSPESGLREYLLAAAPRASSALIDSLNDQARRHVSIPFRQRSAISRLVPRLSHRAPGKVRLRDIGLSAIGYDPEHQVALVFVRRQAAESCDVGEYFVVEQTAAGWQVATRAPRWIS